MPDEKKELRKIPRDELIQILHDHQKWADSEGKEGEQADLSYADLSKIDLLDLLPEHKTWVLSGSEKGMQANLSRAELIGANLQGAELIGADLQGAEFIQANLQGAKLLGADLKGANLIGADLQGAILSSTDLQGADLIGANLQGANIFMANLQGADMRTTNLEGANVTGVHYDREGKYRGIRIETCFGSPQFKRHAQDQDWLEELQERSWWGKPLYYIWLVLADCGRTPWRWMFWSVLLAIWFGLNFFWMGPEAFRLAGDINDPNNQPLPFSYGTTIYYSVVTFTTLGFGDITPKTPHAAWWVMSEVIVGYIMLGGLISILATLLARRS